MTGNEKIFDMGTTKIKVGRDAKTGEFITVEEAERRKATAIVETIKRPTKSKSKSK